MTAPFAHTLYPDQQADFCGDLYPLGIAVANGAPTADTDGAPFFQHNVLIASAAVTGGTAGDTVDFTVWVYRHSINTWFPEITIGTITVATGEAIDRRVPAVFADRVYIQISNVVHTGTAPDCTASAGGWSDRI